MANHAERRFQATDISLVPGANDIRTMDGEAAVCGVWSTGLGVFEERMNPGCFDDVLRSMDLECYSLFNHEASRVLGVTTNGELRLSINAKGNLRQLCDLKGDTVDSQTMRAHLEARRIKRMSFAFKVTSRDDDKWYEKDGVIKREVNRVGGLFDVSPVTYAAYSEANVGIRGLTAGQDPEIDAIMKTLIRCERSLPLGTTELSALKEFHTRLGNHLAGIVVDERKPDPAVVSLQSLKEAFEGLL